MNDVSFLWKWWIREVLLRFSKAPNPSTVRPLRILEQAFDFVMNKYQSTHDWLYISNQLKSIRQDLMVQSIRNDFAILVYEENARLALAMVIPNAVNPWSRSRPVLSRTIESNSFNVKLNWRCCTRTVGIERISMNSWCIDYSILSSWMTRKVETIITVVFSSLSFWSRLESSRILVEINELEPSNDLEHLQAAVELCSAFRRKNFMEFFTLYQALPELAQCLVNLFLDVYRKQTIRILVWG